MEFLAGDALAGRGSGTRDEWIAATYIASHMRRIGLEPAGDEGGFVQAVTIERGQAAAPPVLTVAGERFTHGEQMLVLSMRAARLSGPLHKVSAPGADVPKGAVVLLPPDASAATAPPSQAQSAAMLLLVETPQVPLGGFRLAAPESAGADLGRSVATVHAAHDDRSREGRLRQDLRPRQRNASYVRCRD